jgi:hypothetical protein
MRVLSRKPPPSVAQSNSAAGGGKNASFDETADSEEEERKKASESLAERTARAKREREEKQRKYEIARERLFGSQSPSVEGDHHRSNSKGRTPFTKGKTDRAAEGSSSADQSPNRGAKPKRQLYDPSYSAKPNSTYLQKRENTTSISSSHSADPSQPIRAPRGPDPGSRGFGLAARGRGKASTNPSGSD